jgi:putative spermidine/putrescine transport system permease protein
MSSTLAAPTHVPRNVRRDPGAIALGLYVVLFVMFLLAPIAAVVVFSFSSSSFVSFPMEGWTLRWYHRIFEYQPFMDSLLVSVEIAVGSSAIGAVIGVPAALVVARSSSTLSSLVANLLLAPISIPAIVLGFSLLYFLSALSFGISFLALLITHSVIAVPYVARTALAVYRALPPDLEEAAAILGASRWQTLRLTTLPLLRPGICAGALFAFLISLDNLPVSFFFGTASTNTLPVVMLSYMQNQFDPSIAAMSAVQMLIAVVMLLIVDATYGVDKLTAA